MSETLCKSPFERLKSRVEKEKQDAGNVQRMPQTKVSPVS